ncbi:hypothetical protein JHK85_004176 [Glycine max]|uniref:Uncharacterized protein n=2 Tax=Glycine subgen. Soja TaxID=1462606 RepID=A0A0R0L5M0_SOYBN|nr:hypothetical protein JHK87_003870 [Glycine soja]KAG5062993.1 hypothetical protein JHK85_004176 [Glycine max]KAG5079939.1 hypothetical protein JHK86_004004 [Glycine max]KAH1060124.1 hypothetical protein GYH30_003893 [Glycine max]RZC24781.1 hypothetical protein D0Y65_003805 [Glycine soja]
MIKFLNLLSSSFDYMWWRKIKCIQIQTDGSRLMAVRTCTDVNRGAGLRVNTVLQWHDGDWAKGSHVQN